MNQLSLIQQYFPNFQNDPKQQHFHMTSAITTTYDLGTLGLSFPHLTCFHHPIQKIQECQQSPGHLDPSRRNLHNEFNKPISGYCKEITESSHRLSQNQGEIIHVNLLGHPLPHRTSLQVIQAHHNDKLTSSSSCFFCSNIPRPQSHDNKEFSSSSSYSFVPMLQVIQMHNDKEFGSSSLCFFFVLALQVLGTQ